MPTIIKGSDNFDTATGGAAVLQVQYITVSKISVNTPAYGNNKANFRQLSGYELTVVTKEDNSKIKLDLTFVLSCSGSLSHQYFDVKRNGTWLDQSVDGLYADYHPSTDHGLNASIHWIDEPNVPAGTTVTYTFWVGSWAGGTIGLNGYIYNLTNPNQDSVSQFIATEISA